MAENDSQQSPGTSTHQQPAIMTMPTNIPLPAKLELTGNLATNWKVFIGAWKNYEIAATLKDPSKSNKNNLLRTATFLTVLSRILWTYLKALNLTTTWIKVTLL